MEPRRIESAGGLVLGDSGTVALVRRRPDTLWFFPKGTLEAGETSEEAARREIEEETGLRELELIDDLGSYERPGIHKDGTLDHTRLKTIHMYLFAAPMHAEIHAAAEILEVCWMPLKLVAENLENATDRAWFVGIFERVRQAVQRD